MTAVIVDGKKIAADMQHALSAAFASEPSTPILAVIVVGDNVVTNQFVQAKRTFAESIGVTYAVHRYSEDISQAALIAAVQQVAAQADGVVVQLPLPAHITTNAVLDTIPAEKDVDVLSQAAVARFNANTGICYPPVAGAVRAIVTVYNVPLAGVSAVVLGKGRLVGVPVATYLQHTGAHVRTIDKNTPIGERDAQLKTAAVIVSGVGVPHIITPAHIADGAVLIDAGTSGAGRTVRGDFDPACAAKASIYTKTPGGVGPITVAVLFENLLKAVRVSNA